MNQLNNIYKLHISDSFKKEVSKNESIKTHLISKLEILRKNPWHPGLRAKKIQPKNTGFFSARINKQWRTIFKIEKDIIKILSLSKHYE
jgi:Txe/YoeB family toxin of Txe-Axe toxin-antitoxin module